MSNNFTVCQQSIGGRFIASVDHLCVTIVSKYTAIKSGAAPKEHRAAVYWKKPVRIQNVSEMDFNSVCVACTYWSVSYGFRGCQWWLGRFGCHICETGATQIEACHGCVELRRNEKRFGFSLRRSRWSRSYSQYRTRDEEEITQTWNQGVLGECSGKDYVVLCDMCMFTVHKLYLLASLAVSRHPSCILRNSSVRIKVIFNHIT